MIAKKVTSAIVWIANQAAQINQYNWGADYKKEMLEKSFESFNEEIKKYLDWTQLTKEDCLELRFKGFSEDSEMMLIPLYLLNCIPFGLKLKDINGKEEVYVGQKLDNDIRFGVTAYGIIPGKVEIDTTVVIV